MEHPRYAAPAPFSGNIRFLIEISTHYRMIYWRGEVMVTVDTTRLKMMVRR
ncbi:hypothetical protein Hanom_Chr17g01549371 [Helianthus anomalus]